MTVPGVYRGLRLAAFLAPPLAAEGAFALLSFPQGRKEMHASERPLMDLAEVEHQQFAGKRVVTILLVHGWRGRAANFASIVRELRSAERTIVAFDAPAHGLSSGRRTDISEYAGVISELDRRYGPFDAIVSHSFGTAASLLAVHKGARVGRLASLAGAAQMDYLVSRFASSLELGAATVQGIRRRIEDRIFPGVTNLWTKYPGVTWPMPIDVPLLLIHDKCDTEVEVEQSRRLAAAHPQSARLVITSGLGHNALLRNGAVLDEVVAFLER
jgi:pimeloyl-ACP methyl ester carboxylesterase